MTRAAIVLIGHGSRVARANRTLVEVARALRARLRGTAVQPCYLEAARPGIQEAVDRCVRRGATHLVFAPYFLALGGHVGRDLPAEARRAIGRHPGLQIALARPLGFDRRLVAVVADRVRHSACYDFPSLNRKPPRRRPVRRRTGENA